MPGASVAPVGAHPAVPKAAAREAQGEPAAVDRRRRGLEREGEGADVVLVAVGEDDPAQTLAPLGEVGEVGHDSVDARHLRAGEEHARVEQEQVPLPLEDHRVEAELSQAAERDEPQRSFRRFVLHPPGLS